jgi:hypothetical protein
MESININDDPNYQTSPKVILDFFPQYCLKQGYIWHKMFRIAISSKNTAPTFPNEINILVSSFIMKITMGEYQYYLNTLCSKLNCLKMYSDKGNRLSFNYCQRRIREILRSLESKIGEDIETNGIESFVVTQLERIEICPNKEFQYNQSRIQYNLQKIQKYANEGNQRMTNFFKKITQELITNFEPSSQKLLDNIQISKKKEKSFRDLEINLTFQQAKNYSSLGDRISMNFYKKKLSDLLGNTNSHIKIDEIDDLLTVEREYQFMKKQLFKYLNYAEDKSRLKDQEAMERNLLKSQKYYRDLLVLPIKPDFVEIMENKIKRINYIFTCPL